VSKTHVPFRKVVPSLVTGAGLVFGFLSMLAATQAEYDSAVYLLVAAVFCDLFDGQLARRLKATSRFGQQFDSISDAVSFGVAPAFLVFQALLRPSAWGHRRRWSHVMARRALPGAPTSPPMRMLKDRRTMGADPDRRRATRWR
jgi:phosphatidylserine synthase